MKSSKRNRGFTLLELMIVVAIIGILAAIALPKYGQLVRSNDRRDGQAELLKLAGEQEQRFSRGLPFAAVASFEADNGKYDLSVSVTASSYTATAVAKGVQIEDTACTTLTVDNFGNQTPIDCWVK